MPELQLVPRPGRKQAPHCQFPRPDQTGTNSAASRLSLTRQDALQPYLQTAETQQAGSSRYQVQEQTPALPGQIQQIDRSRWCRDPCRKTVDTQTLRVKLVFVYISVHFSRYLNILVYIRVHVQGLNSINLLALDNSKLVN